MGKISVTEDTLTSRVRLHVTPFNPDLFDRIIPKSLRSNATGVSFHTVETFPERGYGYIELPAIDALSLKKKLNGATLHGMKMRLEEARPEKRRRLSDTNDNEQYAAAKRIARSSKQEQGCLLGHELELGRKIKRGWTKSMTVSEAADDKRDGSVDSRQEKMQFRTKLPSTAGFAPSKFSQSRSDRSRVDTSIPKNRTVVTEFSNRSTLKSSQSSAHQSFIPKRYIDGTGWVDEDGHEIEAEHASAMRMRQSLDTNGRSIGGIDAVDHASRTSTSTEADPNGALSESHLEEDESLSGQSEINRSTSQVTHVDDGSNPNEIVQASEARVVHPLEALFKRAPSSASAPGKPKPAPIVTSFSFFEADQNEEDEKMRVPNLPHTPHTRRELEQRNIRSAAPTPDTAAIKTRFRYSTQSDDEAGDSDLSENGDSVEKEPTRPGQAQSSDRADGSQGVGEESDFRKWFYENRGDLNRKWKERRREERKLKKRRENQRLNRKIA